MYAYVRACVRGCVWVCAQARCASSHLLGWVQAARQEAALRSLVATHTLRRTRSCLRLWHRTARRLAWARCSAAILLARRVLRRLFAAWAGARPLYLAAAARQRVGAVVAARAAAMLCLRVFEAWRRAAAMECVVRACRHRRALVHQLPKALVAWRAYRATRRYLRQLRLKVRLWLCVAGGAGAGAGAVAGGRVAALHGRIGGEIGKGGWAWWVWGFTALPCSVGTAACTRSSYSFPAPYFARTPCPPSLAAAAAAHRRRTTSRKSP
jgi:hypothetical protein